MSSTAPYKPKRRRSPQIRGLLWRGVYHGAIVGFPAGAAVWGFLMLGGAPIAPSPHRAASSLAVCGVFVAVTICMWTWGRDGIALIAPDTVAAIARRIEWPIWPFVSSEDEQQQVETVEAISRNIVRAVVGLPCGLPAMVFLWFKGEEEGGSVARPALHVLSVAFLAGWAAAGFFGWQWICPPPQTPTQKSQTAVQRPSKQQQQADSGGADLDSALQLAVARAKRAKDNGERKKAIHILEKALGDAGRQGRSVAHPGAHWVLGWLYAERGDVDAAMVMFSTVTDLAEPDSKRYKEARSALERLARRRKAASPTPRQINKLLKQDANQQQP